jgi:hypothetical protein
MGDLVERELRGAGAKRGPRQVDTVIAGLTAGGTAKPKQEFLPSDYEPALYDAFLTAYLLTASEELAEAVVCEAIESWDAIDDPSVLRRLVVEAGLKRRPRNHGWRRPARPWVPPELQGVLELSSPLRECFVMRILVELPREACAILMAIDYESVDRYLAQAAVSLSATHQTAALISSNNCGGSDSVTSR